VVFADVPHADDADAELVHGPDYRDREKWPASVLAPVERRSPTPGLNETGRSVSMVSQ
jgi:hypothetical protein